MVREYIVTQDEAKFVDGMVEFIATHKPGKSDIPGLLRKKSRTELFKMRGEMVREIEDNLIALDDLHSEMKTNDAPDAAKIAAWKELMEKRICAIMVKGNSILKKLESL